MTDHHKNRSKGLRTKASLMALFSGLVLAFAPIASHAQSGEEGKAHVSPHAAGSKGKCQVCHKDELPKLLFDPVTTCTKCHPGNVNNHPVTRHPIGKVAKINTPWSLPLTKDGQIVCSTCHEPHNKAAFPKMLRVDFMNLCAACHAGY